MEPRQVITAFYDAFQRKQAEEMAALYAEDAVFEDPVFGRLADGRARQMWRMLVKRGGSDLQVGCSDIRQEGDWAFAKWTASYKFGPKKRPVLNIIEAKMRVVDGKIQEHYDHFSFVSWASMALGVPGMLLGWTPFLRKQVRKKSLNALSKFENKNK